jgi:ATP synthase protein I
MDGTNEHWKQRREKTRENFAAEVSAKEARKIRARQGSDRNLWLWMGMMGMVGWAVALPTVIGIALGVWLDAHYPTRFSWTLTLLFVGVALGCANAWHWVSRERSNDPGNEPGTGSSSRNP